MKTVLVFVVVTASFVWGAPPAYAGFSFTSDSWNLGTTVDNNAIDERDVDASHMVQNNYQSTQMAMVGQSTGITNLDLSWTPGFGQFLIDAMHEAEDVSSSSLFVRSSGGFIFSATDPISVDINASYAFNAPAAGFSARLQIRFLNLDDGSVLFFDNIDDGPSVLGPPVGSMSIDGNVIAPAGSTYLLSYHMSLTTIASGTDVIATGEGSVHFTFAIPEPATAALLLPGFLLLRPWRSAHRHPRPTAPAAVLD